MSRCLRCNAGSEWIEDPKRQRVSRLPVKAIALAAWRADGMPEKSAEGEVGFDSYVMWSQTILEALRSAGYGLVRVGLTKSKHERLAKDDLTDADAPDEERPAEPVWPETETE